MSFLKKKKKISINCLDWKLVRTLFFKKEQSVLEVQNN